MASALHDSIVRKFVSENRGVRTRGFRKAIRRAVMEMNPFDQNAGETEEEFYDLLFEEQGLPGLKLVPDAFSIAVRPGRRECDIDVYEVELSNSFSGEKLAALGDFADCDTAGHFYITLHLINSLGEKYAEISDEELMYLSSGLYRGCVSMRYWLAELSAMRNAA